MKRNRVTEEGMVHDENGSWVTITDYEKLKKAIETYLNPRRNIPRKQAFDNLNEILNN